MPIFNRQQGRLHYSDNGGDGEAILFLHGLGSRGSDWNYQLPAFADKYRVITLDFPGHGDSEALKHGTSMAQLADCGRALLDHLQVDRAHLVGLSLGGMVALQLGLDSSDRVRSLIVINSAPGPGSHAIKFKILFGIRRLLIRIYGVHGMAPRLSRKLFPAPSQTHLREQFLGSVYSSDPSSYRKIVDAIVDFNIDEELEKITAPTLVLSADQDYTPVEFKRKFVAKMPHAKLQVVPNSRHASPLDNPTFCNEAIASFLNNLQGQRASVKAGPGEV